MKRRLLRLGLLGLGLILPLLMAELVLRFLPVQTHRPIQPVNAQNPVMRYEPNRPFVYSRDGDFGLANRGWINNWGFVHPQDYQEAGDPLLAVIGDSYVEAIMVPFAKTLVARLEAPGRRVYGFGFSGSSLADYLAYAEFVRDRFHPQAMLFLIIGNDYDESLPQYRRLPGFHHFEGEKLAVGDFTPEQQPRAEPSALWRYLYYNLHWYQKFHPESVPVQTTPASRVAPSQAAVDLFFKQLPVCAGLPKERIGFVVDGLRQAEGDSDWKRDFEKPVRDYFLQTAARQGYLDVVDLEPVFTAGAARGERYSEKRDFHWNAHGHEVAAREAQALVERLMR